jgi:hypothetical protein
MCGECYGFIARDEELAVILPLQFAYPERVSDNSRAYSAKRNIRMQRFIQMLIVSLLISGCVLWLTWHWERVGSIDADYEADLKFCKSQTDQSINGTVTNETVRRMHGCMNSRGWKRVDNQ